MKTAFPRIYLRMGKNPHNAYEAYRHLSIPYQWPAESSSPKKESALLIQMKKAGWSLYSKLNPIPVLPLSIPNVDLIHSTNNMLLSTNQNWVVDCEYVGAFLGFRYDQLEKKRALLNQIISNPHCKGILFWSQAAKHSFTAFIQNPSLSKKCFVAYPTVSPKKNVKIRKTIKRLLFVGSPFFEKGGKEALAAFRIAHQKDPSLSMTVVSNAPESTQSLYSAVLPITFLPPTQNREQMDTLYRSHDAFILPTFKDSYGIVFLEALSHALPIITTDMFACPELITNKSGLIVPAPFNAYTKDFFFDVKKYANWEGFSNYCEVTQSPAFEQQLAQAILKMKGKKIARFSKAALASYQKKFSLKEFEKQLRKTYEMVLSR